LFRDGKTLRKYQKPLQFQFNKISDLYQTVYGELPTSSWLGFFESMPTEDKQKIKQIMLDVVAEGRAPLTDWRFTI
jgi:hypothetical protein